MKAGSIYFFSATLHLAKIALVYDVGGLSQKQPLLLGLLFLGKINLTMLVRGLMRYIQFDTMFKLHRSINNLINILKYPI